jgi:hypothetical protein
MFSSFALFVSRRFSCLRPRVGALLPPCRVWHVVHVGLCFSTPGLQAARNVLSGAEFITGLPNKRSMLELERYQLFPRRQANSGWCPSASSREDGTRLKSFRRSFDQLLCFEATRGFSRVLAGEPSHSSAYASHGSSVLANLTTTSKQVGREDGACNCSSKAAKAGFPVSRGLRATHYGRGSLYARNQLTC